MSSFYNAIKTQRIIGIVERLRLRNSKRLTVNVIRNQQRNRITLDETNIASPQIMEYYFSPLVGLRRSFISGYLELLLTTGADIICEQLSNSPPDIKILPTVNL